MRKVLLLAALAGAAWWFLGRRRTAARETATVGYADGSSVTLEAGAPELERLLLIASRATAA
jgi:hypothetical protein